MPMFSRSSNKGLPGKPLYWSAAILIVVLIGYLCVRSQGGLPVIGESGSQPLSAAFSPAATGLGMSPEGGPALSSGRPASSSWPGVVSRPTPGAPLGPSNGLMGRATPATTAEARTSQTAAGGAPPAVAMPAAATPTAPAGTPIIGSPPVAEQSTDVSTLPQLQTAPVRSANLGPTGYPQQTTIPVGGLPLTPAPSTPPTIPAGTTLYTPSGTSVYGFKSVPITTQSAVTQLGVTALPVASNQVQPAVQVLPPGATLYTPSGTSVYGITSAPITTQSSVTQLGVTALPVASNQAQSVAQVSPWPAYRVEVGPISGQQGAKEIAESLVKAGFQAKVEATTVGQYTVTLTPPPQSTVAGGLAIVKSVGPALPIKVELVP
jgi:hypothetical protein